MSARLRSIAVALALATILVAEMLEELLRPSRDLIYHWSGTPAALFAPPLIVLLVVSALAAVLVISAERPGYWRALVWTGIVLFVPWLALHKIQDIWPNYMPQWVRLPPPLLLLVLCPLIAIASYRFARRTFESVIDTVSVLLAFTALSTVLFVVQLLWLWWGGRNLHDPMPVHAAARSAATPSGPRIIWIVLDELSYQQVYEHRYPGLQLPAFDALAANATVFTHVTATSDRTEKALPALLSGDPVQQMASNARGILLVRSSPTAAWQQLDEHDTVFGDALRWGYKTAVAGWYNPYCRIFRDVLDSCYWTYFSGRDTFRGNLLVSTDRVTNAPSLRRILNRSLHVPVRFGETPDEAHLEDYIRLNRAADEILRDRSESFSLLHLPIPHPEGIYNRTTGQLTPVGGGYVDNLALADRWLANARASLEASGQWDGSAVIVMGDHGWRTKIWEKEGKWTPEEQLASLGGQYDTRPGYIVKLPGQQTGDRIDEPFDAIRTRALVDELMSGKIHSPQDLKNWVDQGGGANQKDASDMHH